MSVMEPSRLLPAEDALAALLTTESLLLTVVGLAVTIATPNGRRIPRLPIPAVYLALAAVLLLFVVALGAGMAWAKMYLTPFPGDFTNGVIAVSLISVIVAEPVIAALLALGMRSED